jgi:aspartyl-tRNA(Asn)/glutamyl-tRNA(Gln) amidotransferase subunit B
VLNARAVDLGISAALALGSTVHTVSIFARKNYFYPDLPKGYQISQFDRPLATGGGLDVAAPGSPPVRIRLTRIHLEEDAGKSIHDRFPGATAIDLNRAGTPLIEIVSEPDLRSPAQARHYLQGLKEILEYAQISDANMEEGSLRVDANISVRPAGSSALGTRTEIKNLNSFSAVERALQVEFARQCALVVAGRPVVQETLLFDSDSGRVRPSRSKEESHDYRYFPEPDLPALVLEPSRIEAQRAALPELPATRRARLCAEYGVSAADAAVLTSTRDLAEYFEAVARLHGDGRSASTWMTGEVLAALNDRGVAIGRFPIAPARLGELLDLVRAGELSRGAAKRVLGLMIDSGDAARAVAEREGLRQVRNDDALEQWVEAVWQEHPDEAARFRAGDAKLLGVFVGLVMKRSGGRADPRRVNELLRQRASA